MPGIVAYRTGAINFAIAKRVITISRIGLVNIVAGREILREFVQDALIPTDMANALEPLLSVGSVERNAALTGLADVRAQLGIAGAAERVAQMAIGLVA